MMPGAISGRVTVTNTQTLDAPKVPAACSSLGSTASMASQIARTIKGNAMIAAARAAPKRSSERGS